MFNFFGKKKTTPQIIIIGGGGNTQSKSSTVSAGKTGYATATIPVAQTQQPQPCGCTQGRIESEQISCCPSKSNKQDSNIVNRRAQMQTTDTQGSSAIPPKDAEFGFELENTTAVRQKVTLFDPTVAVQLNSGTPGIPAGVTMNSLDKNYQVLLNIIVARVTFFLCDVQYHVMNQDLSIVRAQMDNRLDIVAGHIGDDLVTKVKSYKPSAMTDRKNQRHIEYADWCINEQLEPMTGICFNIEPGAKLRVTFGVAGLIGYER